MNNSFEYMQMEVNWWVISRSFDQADTINALLKARAGSEAEWVSRIDEHTDGSFALAAWSENQIKDEKPLEL